MHGTLRRSADRMQTGMERPVSMIPNASRFHPDSLKAAGKRGGPEDEGKSGRAAGQLRLVSAIAARAAAARPTRGLSGARHRDGATHTKPRDRRSSADDEERDCRQRIASRDASEAPEPSRAA